MGEEVWKFFGVSGVSILMVMLITKLVAVVRGKNGHNGNGVNERIAKTLERIDVNMAKTAEVMAGIQQINSQMKDDMRLTASKMVDLSETLSLGVHRQVTQKEFNDMERRLIDRIDKINES